MTPNELLERLSKAVERVRAGRPMHEALSASFPERSALVQVDRRLAELAMLPEAEQEQLLDAALEAVSRRAGWPR
ncbi:hypothetical protein [Kallotenue papyrolyticum]|uniref:hypothetical protein n=1 Tax=Kallotenue papyrolyticum TaxID=1325125 RepID=UPI00047865B3|nr:hypothetical protein [Kallotenue papyrolyticum]